jgi:TRAP transporter TAXI family solute receptor
MFMVSTILFLAACIATIGSTAGTSRAESGPTRSRISLLMVTGMPGGSYHQLGLAMASLWTTKLKKLGIRVSGAISEGARENIEAIRIQDAELILVDALSCSLAYRGAGNFKNKINSELRSISNLWPEAAHLIIRSDKNRSSSLDDLEGLTVATGLPESGNRFTTEMLLRILKDPKHNIKLKFMNYGSALESLRLGTIQAADLTSAIPSALVTNLLQLSPQLFSFIEITDTELQAVRERGWTTCQRIVIPSETYPGQRTPVNTVGQNTLLVTTSSLDLEVIYDLTKSLFENVDQLAKFHPAFKAVSLENALVGLVAPLHPGAIRYYREKKMQIPEALLPTNVD